MMTKVESVNKYGKFWFDENNILHFKYHPGLVIDLETAKLINIERLKIYNGSCYLTFIDTRNLKYISPSALKYFSTEECTNLITAGAFLIDSFLSKIFGNCFLQIYPPNVPTKLFTNKDEAIMWLKKYK